MQKEQRSEINVVTRLEVQPQIKGPQKVRHGDIERYLFLDARRYSKIKNGYWFFWWLVVLFGDTVVHQRYYCAIMDRDFGREIFVFEFGQSVLDNFFLSKVYTVNLMVPQNHFKR